MNTAQRAIKNMFSLFVSSIVTQITGLGVSLYVARALGPEGFGKISFSIAVIVYFVLFANLGLSIFGVRQIAANKDKAGYYLVNITLLRIFLSIAVYLALMVFVLLLPKPMDVKYLIMIFSLGIIDGLFFIDWVFQALQKMEYIAYAKVIAIGIYAGLVFLFIKGIAGIFYIPLFQFAGNILGAVFLLVIFIRKYGFPAIRADKPILKNILKQALPFGTAMFMIQLIYNVDTVMMGFMRTEREVGYYNAAYKIVLLLIGFGAIYFDAIFPIIAEYYKTSLEKLKALEDYTAKLMANIGLPVAASGMILAGPIMNLCYGDKYKEGAGALQILIWVVFLIYINMIYARGMWACGRERQYVKIVTLQALINIILNIFLIPRFGIIGAALSTVTAELSGFFFYYREFNNNVVKVYILGHVLKPAAASLIMSAFLFYGLRWSHLNLLYLVFAGAVIYIIALIAIKGITKKDVYIIKDIIMNKVVRA